MGGSTNSLPEPKQTIIQKRKTQAKVQQEEEEEDYGIDFYQKNQYPIEQQHKIQSIQKVEEELASGIGVQKIRNILEFVLECQNIQFEDINFQDLSPRISTSVKFTEFYEKEATDRLYTAGNSPQFLFVQKQVELVYLTAVLYHIAKNQKIKENIILTRQVNIHNLYLVNLFCFGNPTIIAIDDKVPMQNNCLSYLNVNNSKQLWPILVEKAWVKQIGNYEKARFLSPEDCFEEITGIPAYSYLIKDHSFIHNLDLFKKAVKNKQWIALTGHITEQEIKSRQIFIIEDFDNNEDSFTIRSPYLNFQIQGVEQKQGKVILEMGKIVDLFQYVTIGYHKPQFQSFSIPIQSSKNEEIVVELNITQQQELSIRFIQFYKEYLSKNEKISYQYSPLCMYLYGPDKNLIQNCEGMPEILEGVRSSYVSKDIFVKLNPAKYYLRLQIQWINNELFNEGNLVIYSNPSNVSMQVSQQNHQELVQQFLNNTLNTEKDNEMLQNDQEIVVKWMEKQYRYLVGFQNVSKEESHIKVKFKDSQNIRINHHTMKKQAIDFHLQPFELKVIQIVAENTKQSFQLAPFDIIKL